MNKIIIKIIISLAILVSTCYTQRENGNIYAISTQGSNASNLNLIISQQFTSTILLEKSITLPSNLSMQAITGINFETGVITLLGISNKLNSQGSQIFNLINYNYNGAQQSQSYGKSFETVKPIDFGNGGKNYIISNNDHVYFVNPLDFSSGINVVDLFFENYNSSSTPSYVNEPSKQFLIQDTSDVDETFAPVGTINIEDGSLVILYHGEDDSEFLASIIICNLNGTDSISSSDSSSVLTPTQSYKIKLYNKVNMVTQLYTDHMGNIYLISNQSLICKVDTQSNSCDEVYYIAAPVFASNLQYNPFIIKQDKSSIISISNYINNSTELQVGTWGYDWQYGYSDLVHNYWIDNNLPQSFTYFAI